MTAGSVAAAYTMAAWFASEHGDKEQEVRCYEIASGLWFWVEHGKPLPAVA